MGGVQRVILGFRTFEKMKLYKARHLLEMTIARQPDLLESCLAPLGHAEAGRCDKHLKFSFFGVGIKNGRYQPVVFPTLTKPKVFLGTLPGQGASLFL